MRALVENIRYGEKNLNFFEWAKVFQPVKNKETLCKEVDILWGVVLGQLISPKWRGESEIADIYFLKGVVLELSIVCHIPLTLSPLSKKDYEYPIKKMLHPYRSLYILHQNDVIEIMGQIHPGISESFGVRDIQPYYMEIQYQHLIHTDIKEKRTIREKRLPPVKRMVSFLIPKQFNAQSIVHALVDSDVSDLIRVEKEMICGILFFPQI